MIKHFCDICEKEIRMVVDPPSQYVHVMETGDDHRGAIEVCEDCMNDIQGDNETFFESVFNIMRNGMKSMV